MVTRQEYSSCVGEGMRGKILSVTERKLEFCTVAKLCSRKAKDREEAVILCNQPKPEKKERTRGLSACERKLKDDERILKQITNAVSKEQWEAVKNIIEARDA